MPKINPAKNWEKMKKFLICGILGESRGFVKKEKCV
jgi:hypothetical protein